jgi:hypothetical protein
VADVQQHGPIVLDEQLFGARDEIQEERLRTQQAP